MRDSKFLHSILLITSFVVFPWHAQAWGERGHHTVCDEATRQVKEEGLKNFLKMRGHVMGHTCNIPDIYWKSLPSNISGIGNPTHFIEPDMAGVSIKDTPTVFSEFLTKLSAAGSPTQIANKVGTLWWRADQLFNLALESAKTISTRPLPANSKEEQSNDLLYNQDIYNMMTYMGIMGHYVGDASMPYHNWADYDGYGIGHGGLHAYYESTCVGEYGSDLGANVSQVAKRLPYTNESYDTTLVLKRLSREAVEEVPAMEKLDVVLQASTQFVNEMGMTIKTPAVRPDPKEQCSKFKPMIVLEIARSAKALAYLWDQIYIKAGRPNLAAYKSYRYPLTPDFIVPTYLPPPTN